jgi:hypothetical protein
MGTCDNILDLLLLVGGQMSVSATSERMARVANPEYKAGYKTGKRQHMRQLTFSILSTDVVTRDAIATGLVGEDAILTATDFHLQGRIGEGGEDTQQRARHSPCLQVIRVRN